MKWITIVVSATSFVGRREGKSGYELATAVTLLCAQKTVKFVVYILSVEMVQQKRILILCLSFLVKKVQVYLIVLLHHCLSFELIFDTVFDIGVTAEHS